MAKIVLCFGNPYVKEDNLAIKIAEELKIEGVDFKIITDPAHIAEYAGYEEIIMMDVVKGIDKVTVISDVDKLKDNKTVTMHDMDLGFYLKLLNEMGIVKRVRIIGIPMKADVEKVKRELTRLLE